MKDFLEEYLDKILNIIIVILALSIIVILVFDIKLPKKEEEVKEQTEEVALVKEEIVDEENKKDTVLEEQKYYVDIKGAVKKPGVYEVNKDMIINDVIELAGGLKSNASTKYLNLSKKVTNEMVINIFTTSEIKDLNVASDKECISPSEDIKDCSSATVVESNSNVSSNDSVTLPTESQDENVTSEPTSSKVNINMANLNELMSISGIGEAKAKAILEYRNTKGKFKTIEEIKNVSGIGDALYEKIKNSITV